MGRMRPLAGQNQAGRAPVSGSRPVLAHLTVGPVTPLGSVAGPSTWMLTRTDFSFGAAEWCAGCLAGAAECGRCSATTSAATATTRHGPRRSADGDWADGDPRPG